MIIERQTMPNQQIIEFSQKSRTTLMSGMTGSPSSGRINGVGPCSRAFELRPIHDFNSSRRGCNTCA
ncbi:hypothetical protein CEXT_610981 [Caerostris extrusa]|uniref:Uncharacterized protein n=1 Tax=Caerostris extrusa TaxID=172846 RepID=A0AAV4MIR6_CAEEX|nr:hypothetical protein CEXT_610981 [Caerostris extrusa]